MERPALHECAENTAPPATMVRSARHIPALAAPVQQSHHVDLADAIGKCRTEALLLQPWNTDSEHLLQRTGLLDILLDRGVTVRVLREHNARLSLEARRAALTVERRGGETRTVAQLFGHLILLDREFAIVCQSSREPALQAYQDAALVPLLRTMFQQLWSSGWELNGPTNGELSDMQQQILALLVDGTKDAAIARRLGISVRTCRRHISELLRMMGAQSRFQAGYLARERRERRLRTSR